MSLCTDYGKLLEKHKEIWTKTKDINNVEKNALPVTSLCW